MMVASRFQAVTNGDWSSLLELLELDRVREKKRQEVRRRKARGGRGPQEDIDRKREVVLGLASKGKLD